MGSRSNFSRRDFLKSASSTLALPYILTSTALGNAERPPASDRIVMGGIGIGNMGRGDLGAFLGRGDVQYVAVCDVRKSFRNDAKSRVDRHYDNEDCASYNDFRELLARTDIDAVHVATPDHWHVPIALMAARAGKDAYVEKPLGLTLEQTVLCGDVVILGKIFGHMVEFPMLGIQFGQFFSRDGRAERRHPGRRGRVPRKEHAVARARGERPQSPSR